MTKIWSLLFIIIGIIYLIRGYLIHISKLTKVISGTYILTTEQQKSMVRVIAPYYMITGCLLIISPFLQPLIGNLIWILIILYLLIGAIRISKKRSDFHYKNKKS
ncbi:MAG: hypothetical protein ACRC1P_01570 [Cellulosilyticaceae bacterium]